ncbi:MAG: glycyl-radical enzyme activating protein [Polyangia bacterium]
MAHPLIVDIKRHSLEDGPGIRSVVFFKGCPLRCVFCQNPETQDFGPQIAFRSRRCIDCAICAGACPHGAIGQPGPSLRNPELCTICGECTRACPSGGLSLVGQRLSVDQILDVVLRDKPFYRHSGGGVTLSGGECTAFPEFVGELLSRLHNHGISTAIETCGEFSYPQFTQWILPHVDLVLFDVKVANDNDHVRFTGRGSRRIWANLAELLATCPERVQPRIPLIPGITATRENLAALAARLAQLGARSLTLLPYNPLGAAMAESLGRPAPAWLPNTSAWGEQCSETIAWFKTEAARHCFEVLSA